MLKKLLLVVSMLITELFFQEDVTRTSNYGTSEVNANTPLKKTTTQTGFPESGTLLLKRTVTLQLSDGTEDSKFGLTNSNSSTLSKLMMNQSMLYLLLQLDPISVLVEKTMSSKVGILEV